MYPPNHAAREVAADLLWIEDFLLHTASEVSSQSLSATRSGQGGEVESGNPKPLFAQTGGVSKAEAKERPCMLSQGSNIFPRKPANDLSTKGLHCGSLGSGGLRRVQGRNMNPSFFLWASPLFVLKPGA